MMGRKIPRHQRTLSKVFWEIVDGLHKNDFSIEEAELVANFYFRDFRPTSRERLKVKAE